MPLFVLPDETGHLVSLDTLIDKGPVAITFHRGYWCPYCRINTRALAEAQHEIAAEGGQIPPSAGPQHYTAGPRQSRTPRFPS
jgi:peroxiredoxin